MTPHDRAVITKRLNRIARCRGCGGWVWHHADYRPCTTCQVLAKRREIGRLLGVGG